jgi:hypothetical protein
MDMHSYIILGYVWDEERWRESSGRMFIKSIDF